jgi:hypothetical protein
MTLQEVTQMDAVAKIIFALTLGATAVACGGAPSEDVGSTDEADSVHGVTSISTISYAPNSYVIGNAYPGWHDAMQGAAQFNKGPGNSGGAYYRWGFLYGEHFDHCGWIGEGTATSTGKAESPDLCGAPQEQDTDYFLRTFTNGIHDNGAGDGSDTHMHYAGSGCNNRNGYGNVDPWRVPSLPANTTGVVPDGRLLRWRYVSRDGQWVLVHDPSNDGSKDLPNWYFVHRGCVSLANGYLDSE